MRLDGDQILSNMGFSLVASLLPGATPEGDMIAGSQLLWYRKRGGIKVSPHKLRPSMATFLLSDGTVLQYADAAIRPKTGRNRSLTFAHFTYRHL